MTFFVEDLAEKLETIAEGDDDSSTILLAAITLRSMRRDYLELRERLAPAEKSADALEDALIAVKLLADALGDGTFPTAIPGVLARAKELAPGAWQITREEP